MSDNNAARKGDEIIHSSIFADITSIVAEGAAYAVIGAAVGAAATVAAPLLGAGAAAAIALVRIVLVGFTFGNLSMMLYSLAGAAVSLLLMVVFRRLDWFGVTGVSILGGAGHNIGQLIVAALVVENASLFYYLPVLLAAGTAAGALIGLLGGILVNRLKCLDLTKFM